jgi:hypothetical protein
MAETLAELADRYDVMVTSDSVFQRRARLLQARWRERHGYPIGPRTRSRDDGTPIEPGHDVWRPLCSRLAMPFAADELANFLSPGIRQLVRDELAANAAERDRRFKKLFGWPRLVDDLLSSQPMCFNLFGPLALDLDAATRVARRLWPDRVDTVTAVRFEYSPGRGDPRYLQNNSAADALIEHTTPAGGVGIIAVETKYHENLRGSKAEPKARYDEVADASGAFHPDARDRLRRLPLQQIWLDHLLALAWQQADGLDAALFVLAYPALNPPVAKAAGDYAACLVDGDDTYQALTLEQIHAAIAAELDTPEVAAFAERYLAFDTVPER